MSVNVLKDWPKDSHPPLKLCSIYFRFYVQREIEYSYISTMGEVNVTALQNWEAYLEK